MLVLGVIFAYEPRVYACAEVPPGLIAGDMGHVRAARDLRVFVSFGQGWVAKAYFQREKLITLS
jgi:hypothetical protein